MANEILVHTEDTPICWADPIQYAVGTFPTNTYDRTYNISLKGLTAAGGAAPARQSDRVDLGARRAQGYAVKSSIMFATAPTAGAPVEYYWSSSNSSHPASGNAGGGSPTRPYVSGVDGTFVPAGGAEADVNEYKAQLSFVGVLSSAADAGNAQVGVINSYFSPPERYGQFVVKNGTAVALHAGGSGMYIAMVPVKDEIAS